MNSQKNGAHVAAVIAVALLGVHAAAISEVTPREADVHADGTIDILDLLQVVASINQFCDCPADVNDDGLVNVTDIRQVVMFWGQAVSHDDQSDDASVPAEEPVDNGDAEPVYAGPDPVLLDGIYYDALSRNLYRSTLGVELDQGWRTRGHNRDYGIAVLPYAYGGGVDYNGDMTYTSTDLEKFEAWLDVHVPHDYTGPVVLDMEGEWWTRMTHATQEEMDEIIDFYIQGLEYAKAMRPDAKFGYWGLPKKHMTVDHYDGPPMTRLLRASDAIFPDTYETNPGRDDSDRLRRHIERCIELVEGEVPVYAQMFPRHRNEETRQWCYYHEQDEFLRDQAKASLDARWVDARGRTHRVAGIAVWDCYNYARLYHDNWFGLSHEEITRLWDEIDFRHFDIYRSLRSLVAEYEVGGSSKVVTELPAQPRRFTKRRATKPIKLVNRRPRALSTSGRGVAAGSR